MKRIVLLFLIMAAACFAQAGYSALPSDLWSTCPDGSHEAYCQAGLTQDQPTVILHGLDFGFADSGFSTEPFNMFADGVKYIELADTDMHCSAVGCVSGQVICTLGKYGISCQGPGRKETCLGLACITPSTIPYVDDTKPYYWRQSRLTGLDVIEYSLVFHHKVVADILQASSGLWEMSGSGERTSTRWDDLDTAKAEAEKLYAGVHDYHKEICDTFPGLLGCSTPQYTQPSRICDICLTVPFNVPITQKEHNVPSTCTLYLVQGDDGGALYCGDHVATEEEIQRSYLTFGGIPTFHTNGTSSMGIQLFNGSQLAPSVKFK